MGFFHIRSLPGTSWPAVPYPQVGLVWNAYEALERTQWLKPSEIESLQLRQLNALLDHCRKQVPYYARLLSDAGFSRPLLLSDAISRPRVSARRTRTGNTASRDDVAGWARAARDPNHARESTD